MKHADNADSNPACKLTVVLIGRNEEQFIGGAIESVLQSAPQISGLEVIFVDSASTDRSIEIAQQYPICVLQLKRDWPLCVAAGRYTGYLHSHGEYVFFQDGDSHVEADWLVQGIEFMDSHPEYGAIAGVLDEEYVDAEGKRDGGVRNVRQQDLSKDVCDTKHLGGLALYRRSAMEAAGPVNPHLPTAEDHELCMRIRNAGYKLARIKGRMAVKFTENRKTLHEALRRSRTKMFDYGTVIRYAGQYGCAWQFSIESLSYILSFCAAILFFLIAAPIAYYFGVLWIIGVLGALAGIGMIVKKGSVYAAAVALTRRIISTYRTIVSYLKTQPKPIEDYPTDVIQIRYAKCPQLCENTNKEPVTRPVQSLEQERVL